ncbi:MAG: DUF3592 domain-containing protein [Rhodospirillales bacterium]|nr:DUF3592 domain-containing protein [Rhodospirillales bacterium]
MTMTTIILLAIGFMGTLLSGAAVWQAVKLHLVGQRTTGVLLYWQHTNHHRWLGNGRIMRSRHYHPVVRFEASDNAQHHVVSELAYEEVPNWPVDRPFVVRYDPKNPRNATIDPLDSTWIFPAIFLFGGLVVIYATVYPLLSAL